MTWSDRWETKLFLEGHGTARWNVRNAVCIENTSYHK